MRRVRLILCLICVATRLPAQWQLAVDAGTAHLRQTGLPESNALTLGASIDALGERTALRSRVLATRGSGGAAWTGQGVVLASVVGPYVNAPNWELSGAVSGFGETNTPSTTSAEGMARLRLGSTAFGGAIGGAGGVLSSSNANRGLYRAQATAWRTFAADQLVADASFVGTGAAFGGAIEATRYTDLSLSWRRDHRGFELGATAGARAGWQSAATGGWGSLDATAWLAPNVGLVAAAGRSLEDVPRGVPRTQYVSISLRIAARSHAGVFEARPPALRPVVTRDGVVLRIDGAASVELMADFTDWAVLPLERAGDAWRLNRAVPPGLHRVAIRIDGGEWTSPPGLSRATDDLGGVVGLITVP